MESDRLIAFTDGVIAIIITIMVLELKPPHGVGLRDILDLWPVFLSYALSFAYVAIYWNNHHHFFQLVEKVDGRILWANMHLLFWISLIPFATAWVGEHKAEAGPTALYGFSLLMSAIAWNIMQRTIIRHQGQRSSLKQAIGSDLKGKLAPALYLAGIGLAFVSTVTSNAIYALVACMWLVPDRRIEKAAADA